MNNDINSAINMLLSKDLNKIPYLFYDIVSNSLKDIIKELAGDDWDDNDADIINSIKIVSICICQQANIANLLITNVGDPSPSKLELDETKEYTEEDVIKLVDNYINKSLKNELIVQLTKLISAEVSTDQDVLTSATQFAFYLGNSNDENVEDAKVQTKLALVNLIKLCTKLNKKDELVKTLAQLGIDVNEFILDNLDLFIE